MADEGYDYDWSNLGGEAPPGGATPAPEAAGGYEHDWSNLTPPAASSGKVKTPGPGPEDRWGRTLHFLDAALAGYISHPPTMGPVGIPASAYPSYIPESLRGTAGAAEVARALEAKQAWAGLHPQAAESLEALGRAV